MCWRQPCPKTVNRGSPLLHRSMGNLRWTTSDSFHVSSRVVWQNRPSMSCVVGCDAERLHQLEFWFALILIKLSTYSDLKISAQVCQYMKHDCWEGWAWPCIVGLWQWHACSNETWFSSPPPPPPINLVRWTLPLPPCVKTFVRIRYAVQAVLVPKY